MELDYDSLNAEIQQLRDLQTKFVERLDTLQSYLSSVAKANCYNSDEPAVDSYSDDAYNKIQRQFDAEQSALDRMWENKVYSAVYPDADKPLSAEELKSYGFGVSTKDYETYMNNLTSIQEVNQI